MRGRPLVFHMCIPCDKDHSIIAINIDLVTLKFDQLFKNFNIITFYVQLLLVAN